MGLWARVLGFVVLFCVLAVVSPASVRADSGSISDVHPTGFGEYRATFTTTSTECSSSGYCGWFPFAIEARVDQVCDPESHEVIYVGDGAEFPTSETGSDTFSPNTLP